MNLLKIILIFVLFQVMLFSSQAIQKKRVFTQPDGTKFEGILKGDSSFHWIESGGDIVIYNKEDKFYHKAIIDKDKGLIITKEKPVVKLDNILTSKALVPKKHDVSKQDRQNLYILYKKSKTGNYPR
jgi:hypothetical protein